MRADGVASPEIRYSDEMNCLLFWTDDVEAGHVGRVLFEGFDAIRVCRGEHMPYEDDWSADDYPRYPWVFEVDDSRWLRERDEYETRHYQTPLLEEYVHYVFRFHDEYVELIAKGIWFDEVRYAELADVPVDLPADHPLLPLPDHLPAEEFEVEGIRCGVRHNPLTRETLVERSRLCSQKLFQYCMTLDGQTKPSYAAELRTVRDRPMTRLRGGPFYPDRLAVEGAGEEAVFRSAFAQYVSEVAERRRQMGKTNG